MDIGRGGDNGLGAPDHDAAGAAPGDVHVGITYAAWACGTTRAVALAVCHGDAEGEVLGLHPVQVGEKTLVQSAAGLLIDAPGRLMDGVEPVLRQVSLGAAGVLADEAHGLQLVELVGGGAVDVEEAVDLGARALLHRDHRVTVALLAREIVDEPQGRDTRPEAWLVGDGGDLVAVDIDARREAPQRLPVLFAGHQHPAPSAQPASASRCRIASAMRSTRSAFS